VSPAAAIYARRSLKQEEDKSVRDQIDTCLTKAVELGYEVGPDDVYSDPDISGWKDKKRPALNAMLQAVEAGKYGAVIFWKSDRLVRHYYRGNEIANRISSKARLISVTEQIDTSTPIGQALLGFVLAQAQQEAENTSLRTRQAAVREAAKGVPGFGGNRTFGYRKGTTADGPTLELEPKEAKVARQIVKRILDGESLRSAAKWLNAAGHTTTTGKLWSHQVLRQWLRSPTVAGLRELPSGDVFEGKWPALITSDEREALLIRLANNRTNVAKIVAPSRHLLSGLLRCGDCGGPMYVTTYKAIGQAGRYTCYKEPGKPWCGKLSAFAQPLEACVTDQVLTFLSGVKIRPLPTQVDPSSLRQSLVAIEQRLKEVNRRHLVTGELTREEWQPAHDELVQQLNATRDALEAAERQPTSELRPGSRDDLDAWWVVADNNVKRQALASTCELLQLCRANPKAPRRFDPSRVQITWNWGAYERAGYAEPDLKVDAKKYSEQYGVTEDVIEAITSADNARLRRTMQTAPAKVVAAAAKADEEPAPRVSARRAEASTNARERAPAKSRKN
jgi:site-specific DNA recombinase